MQESTMLEKFQGSHLIVHEDGATGLQLVLVHERQNIHIILGPDGGHNGTKLKNIHNLGGCEQKNSINIALILQLMILRIDP